MIIGTDILERFQVRKTKKQKLAFIDYIRSVCEEKGIDVKVEEKRSLLKTRNIVIGDPDTCDFVVGAHYDTCAVMPVPNFITPRNLLFFILFQLVLCVFMFAPAVLVAFVLYALGVSLPIAFISFNITLLLVCVQIICGISNKHTANDNTSGVVTVLETLFSMTPEQRSRVCFVLFDLEEVGLVGSSAFAAAHENIRKNTVLINLDCVSDGDHIMAALPKKFRLSTDGARFARCIESACEKHSKNARIFKRETTIYPSDQVNFKNGVAISSMNRSRLIGLYMNRIHTPRDTVFDENNISCIKQAIIDFSEA